VLTAAVAEAAVVKEQDVEAGVVQDVGLGKRVSDGAVAGV